MLATRFTETIEPLVCPIADRELFRASASRTIDGEMPCAAMASGLSQMRIANVRAPRMSARCTPLIALSFGYILAGAIVVEYVFSYPGIGLLTIDAINRRDYPVLEGLFLLLTVGVILANFIADLLYFKLDPRVTT